MEQVLWELQNYDCWLRLEKELPQMKEALDAGGCSPQRRQLRKPEAGIFSLAEKTANRIRAVAEQIPAVELPSYVRSPYGFVTAVTMEYKQLDRLILFFHKTALFYEKDTAQGRCHSVS